MAGAILWSVNVNKAAAGQTLTIYDAPAVDATKIVAVVDLSGVGSWWYGCLMNGGLFYVISGGSPDVTIGYA